MISLWSCLAQLIFTKNNPSIESIYGLKLDPSSFRIELNFHNADKLLNNLNGALSELLETCNLPSCGDTSDAILKLWIYFNRGGPSQDKAGIFFGSQCNFFIKKPSEAKDKICLVFSCYGE